MKRILSMFMVVGLGGCGLDLAQARSVLDSVTGSPLYGLASDCVRAGLDAEGDAGDKARAIGRCVVFGQPGAEAAPVLPDAELEEIGERALVLAGQVEDTEAAIASERDDADELARGCRVLAGELEQAVER